MKSYKRILSVVICILMLSLTTAYAEDSVSYVLDFSEFDDMVPEEIGGKYSTMNVNDIPWDKGDIESLLGTEIENWVGDQIASWDGENDTAHFYIKKHSGREGAGLVMRSCQGTNTELWFVQETLDTEKVSIFSYDFKVTRRNLSIDNCFSIAGGWQQGAYVNKKTDSNYLVDQSNANNKASFLENTWYTVVVIVDGYNLTSYLFDEFGNQLMSSNKVYTTSDTKTKAKIARLDGYVDSATEMLIDNIQKHVYYPKQTAPSMIASSIVSGEDEIRRNTSFEFTFNQEIDGNIVIYDKNGESIANFDTVKTTKTAYNKVKVTLEDGFMLDRNENYTISFKGIVNSANVACDTEDITFTTEDLHVWNDVIVGNVLQNGENTDITFTLDDRFGYSKFSGAMIVARYENGVMEAASTISLEDVAVGTAVTKSFNLGILTDASEFKLMLLDLTNGPVAIAIGEKQ